MSDENQIISDLQNEIDNQGKKVKGKHFKKGYSDIYTVAQYKRFRTETWVKQDGKCAGCGKELKAGYHLHHIDGNHENNKPYNRMVLCPLCHVNATDYKWNYSNLDKYLTNFREEELKNLYSQIDRLKTLLGYNKTEKEKGNIPHSIFVFYISADVTFKSVEAYGDKVFTYRYIHYIGQNITREFDVSLFKNIRLTSVQMEELFAKKHTEHFHDRMILSINNVHASFQFDNRYYALTNKDDNATNTHIHDIKKLDKENRIRYQRIYENRNQDQQ